MNKIFFIAFISISLTANALPCPDDNHPHAIDLGLPSGTKWSCCNLDAEKPEEPGNFYLWGETKPNGRVTSYTKFRDIGENISGTQYDAAHVRWGGDWVLPTTEQIKELARHTTVNRVSYNDVVCYRLRSKVNDNYIFLPEFGHFYKNGYLEGYSMFWSSNLSDMYDNHAFALAQEHNAIGCHSESRLSTFFIRPVCK